MFTGSKDVRTAVRAMQLAVPDAAAPAVPDTTMLFENASTQADFSCESASETAPAVPTAAQRPMRPADVLTRHAALVRRIARRVAPMRPGAMDEDDLVQAGTLALLEAARNYDGAKGASFETFAAIRIHGAMVDEIRGCSWAPRSTYTNARRVAVATNAVEQRTARPARIADVAQALGISIGACDRIAADTACLHVPSLDGDSENGAPVMDPAADETPVIDVLDRTECLQALCVALAGLPPRERQVMQWHYRDGLSLRDVGSALGVSGSRACQIRDAALVTLREMLAPWAPGGVAPHGDPAP